MCCVLVGYCSIDCNRCSSDMFLCIFFFKQKTAYEMRISDWSSDVCSSDLGHHRRVAAGKRRRFAPALAGGQIDVEQMELVVARADRAMIVDHEAAIGEPPVVAPERERAGMHPYTIPRPRLPHRGEHATARPRDRTPVVTGKGVQVLVCPGCPR